MAKQGTVNPVPWAPNVFQHLFVVFTSLLPIDPMGATVDEADDMFFSARATTQRSGFYMRLIRVISIADEKIIGSTCGFQEARLRVQRILDKL